MDRTTFNRKEKRILFVAAVILLLVVSVGSWRLLTHHGAKRSIRKTMLNVGINQREKIERFIFSLQDIPDYIAFPLGNTHLSESDLGDLLQMIVKNNDEIYGSACAFEPYAYKEDQYYFAPYYYGLGEGVRRNDLGTEEYDYFSWNWYLLPKRLKKAVWTEPFFDEGGGGVNMTTYAVPIFKYDESDSTFIGVITVDLTLQWVDKIIESIQYLKTGQVLLLSRSGIIISTSRDLKDLRFCKADILAESIASLSSAESGMALRELGRKILQKQTGVMNFPIAGDHRLYVGHFPLRSCDWSLVLIYEDES